MKTKQNDPRQWMTEDELQDWRFHRQRAVIDWMRWKGKYVGQGHIAVSHIRDAIIIQENARNRYLWKHRGEWKCPCLPNTSDHRPA